MSTSAAITGALGAAALFAAGTTLQYRAARPLERDGSRRQRSIPTRAVRQTVTSVSWLLGTLVLAVGISLHAFALHEGPITMVQPLLITGVLFALPASRYVGGPRVDWTDMRWAVLLVIALALFLFTATPGSQAATNIDTAPALGTLGLALIGIVACLLVARRCRGNASATVLGAAAGIALAGSAALLKVNTNLTSSGLWDLLGHWQVYALVIVGGCALVLSQVAYRAGPMTASLPAINSVNPIASVLIGWAVFDERFRVGVAPTAVETLLLAVVVIATAALSRRSADRSRPLRPRLPGELSAQETRAP
jgi:drug/metabolite transporter (DMT)-like permease